MEAESKLEALNAWRLESLVFAEAVLLLLIDAFDAH